MPEPRGAGGGDHLQHPTGPERDPLARGARLVDVDVHLAPIRVAVLPSPGGVLLGEQPGDGEAAVGDLRLAPASQTASITWSTSAMYPLGKASLNQEAFGLVLPQPIGYMAVEGSTERRNSTPWARASATAGVRPMPPGPGPWRGPP